MDDGERYEPAVGAGVDAVPPVSAIDEIRLTFGVPRAAFEIAVGIRHQVERSIDDRSVDNLPLSGSRRFPHRRHHAERQKRAASAEVASQNEWGDWWPVGLADSPKRAGEREEVEVESGPLGQRSSLSITTHSPVDELGVTGETLVGAESQPFRDARTEALDQPVGFLDEVQHGFHTFGRLEINLY